jgi:tellurite resistance protein TerC
METLLIPFSQNAGLYAGFIIAILLLLVLDLGLFHRKDREPTYTESALWSLAWIVLAIAFGIALYFYALGLTSSPVRARELGMEYLTGYLIEKSLALDNIFIFVLVFTAFGIPSALQHRVLFLGILGALFFRVVFIAAGSWLMQFHSIVIGFGVLLIATGIKVVWMRNQQPDPKNGWIMRMLRKVIPITDTLHGNRFWVKLSGRWHATPLLAALVVIEAADILFAVDSVPAIFAVTKEPFIVLTSNVFAILGLRSLFFLISAALVKLRFLAFGLGALLVFVGAKMTFLNALFGGKFPITWSLAIIAGVLSVTALASWLWPGPKPPGKRPGEPTPTSIEPRHV